MKTNNKIWLTIIGLVIVFGFPALPLTSWLDEFSSVWHLVRYELVWWSVVIFVLIFVRYVEKRDFSSIGLVKPKLRDIPISFLMTVIMIAGFAVIFFVIFPLFGQSEQNQVDQLVATPFWWRFISVIRAAVGEEVLFRGYGLERLNEILKNLKLAAFISWLIFTLEHLNAWSVNHLLIAGFGGLILTVFYLWKRNLWLNIITHFLVDGVAVLT